MGCAQVPNFDVLIPTAGNNKVGILTNKLCAENSILVTWHSTTPAFERFSELASLFVVDTDFPVFSCSEKGFAVTLVISRQKLVSRIKDFMELTTRCGVEVKQRSLSVGRNHDIFSNSWSFDRAPPMR